MLTLNTPISILNACLVHGANGEFELAILQQDDFDFPNSYEASKSIEKIEIDITHIFDEELK